MAKSCKMNELLIIYSLWCVPTTKLKADLAGRGPSRTLTPILVLWLVAKVLERLLCYFKQISRTSKRVPPSMRDSFSPELTMNRSQEKKKRL